MNVFQNIVNKFKHQGALAQIIIINLVVFLTINISIHILHLSNIADYVVVSLSNFEFLFKPWTLVTFMFTHLDFFHLFTNMFLFYFVGQLYYLIFGNSKLIYIYVMSGISGVVLLLLLNLVFPTSFSQDSFAFGASASIFGIITLMAIYTPNYLVTIFFGMITIKYKYFAIGIFILLTVIDFSINMGGKITHIGGALFGLLYGYYLKKDVDLFRFSLFNKKSKLTVATNNYRTVDDDYNENKFNKETRLNELLDKINKSGYNSLSKREREELHKLSQ